MDDGGCRHSMPGNGHTETPEYRREQDIHRKQKTKTPPLYEREGELRERFFEITIYEISRYRRKEKEDRKKK